MTKPEDLLDPAGLDRLNCRFYEGAPGGYLRQRLAGLLLLAGHREELEVIRRGGLAFESVQLPAESAWLSSLDPEAGDAFLLADSQVVLHHATEVLLRLLLAHSDDPVCPWLELSELRDPKKFKKLVRDRLVPRDESAVDERHRLGRLIFGEDSELAPTEEIAVTQYVAFFAEIFLDGAPLYNAAKHGMALVAEEDAGFRLADGDETVIDRRGPGLEFLRLVETEWGERWARGVELVDLEFTLQLISVAIFFVEATWEAGAIKYLPRDRRHFFRLTRLPPLGELLRRAETGIEGRSATLDYFRSETDRTHEETIIDLRLRLLNLPMQ